MAFSIRLHLDDCLYVRDPEETDLGRRIVDTAIRQLDEHGFERFTFRRLAEATGSTEASIYRYFQNKHRLLLYLVSWYWSWVDYRLEIVALTEPEAVQRLRRAVQVLLESHTTYDPRWSHIDEVALHRIVVVESHKAYQTQRVDDLNAEGMFSAYKGLTATLAELIRGAAPDYPFPTALASTLVEASHQQIFFAQHLPSMTELKAEGDDFSQVGRFLDDLLSRVLGLPRE